ncbi:DNA polymerase III subunit delta [Candidatus Peregrinibacteria bacterium]|nr:DNA polymerase III subunit delta [Candidatus Peregrinibacteria bacterium]
MAEEKVKSTELKNLYLFCGEDGFSILEKAQSWKQKFIEKYGDLNVICLLGEDISAADIQTALESYPFLSEKKLILISDFLRDAKDEEQKTVAELIENVPDFAVLVFVESQKPDARKTLYKRLVKIGQLEEFKAKTGLSLSKWIREKAGKTGLLLGEKEIEHLAEICGGNLWQISNELQKIKLFAAGAKVDLKMIDQVASKNLTSTIFKLTDFLGARRLREALEALGILVDSGEEVVGMFYMLVRHFRLMAQVKSLLDRGESPGEVAKIMKEHPFVVSKLVAQSKGFSAEFLREIYRELLNIDAGFKTGRIRITTHDDSELVRELQVFITRVCLE